MEHTTKNSPPAYGAGNPSGRRRRTLQLPPPPQPGSFLAWMKKFEDGWDSLRLSPSK